MAARCPGDQLTSDLIAEQALPFGHKDITFHLLTLNVCCTLASLAIGVSVFHIMQHALHYRHPHEQKHIIRILFVIPVYAWTTLLSYVFYRRAVYCELVRECYSAYAVASFFTLMCHYIAPDLHEQKEYFRHVEPKNWGWPLNWFQKLTGGEHKGLLRRPRSGITWFNINYIGIFQYVVLRTIVTTVAVITSSLGQFCKGSHNVRYASLWTAIFDALSVLVAMYCLHQIYGQLKEDLAPNRPVFKMVCVKLIVFFTYWQTWLISLLIQYRALRPTRFIAELDLHVGITCLLTCTETLVFAVLHYWAFPWRPYKIDRLPKFPEQRYECGPNEALVEVLNPWDYCCAAARGSRWLFHGIHFRNESVAYKSDCKAHGPRTRGGTQSEPLHDGSKKSWRCKEKDRKTA